MSFSPNRNKILTEIKLPWNDVLSVNFFICFSYHDEGGKINPALFDTLIKTSDYLSNITAYKQCLVKVHFVNLLNGLTRTQVSLCLSNKKMRKNKLI